MRQAAARMKAALSSVTGTGAAATIALALLVLVCTFIAVSLPRASLGYRTQVLHRAIRAAPSSQTTVLGDADISGETISGVSSHPVTAAQLAAAQRKLAAGLLRNGLPLAPAGAQWADLTSATSPFSGGRPPTTGALTQVELLYRSHLLGNAALVTGSVPTRVAMRPNSGTFQVAVTAATAA